MLTAKTKYIFVSLFFVFLVMMVDCDAHCRGIIIFIVSILKNTQKRRTEHISFLCRAVKSMLWNYIQIKAHDYCIGTDVLCMYGSELMIYNKREKSTYTPKMYLADKKFGTPGSGIVYLMMGNNNKLLMCPDTPGTNGNAQVNQFWVLRFSTN